MLNMSPTDPVKFIAVPQSSLIFQKLLEIYISFKKKSFYKKNKDFLNAIFLAKDNEKTGDYSVDNSFIIKKLLLIPSLKNKHRKKLIRARKNELIKGRTLFQPGECIELISDV